MVLGTEGGRIILYNYIDGRPLTNAHLIIVRAAEFIDYADRYAFIASLVLFMIFCRKKQRTNAKKVSNKGPGLARCRRRKIYAMIAVEMGAPG